MLLHFGLILFRIVFYINFRPSKDMLIHTYKKKKTCEEHERMIHALYCRFGDRGTDFAHVLLGLEAVPTGIPSISMSF